MLDMTAPFRIAFVGLCVAVASLVAPRAGASESYPEAIERALGTPCPPACITCHTRPSGGELTANTPVGISARRAGLKCCDTSGLFDMLATLEANATDSDADGTPDVDELRAGTNPNALEGKLECYVPPEEEGCAMSGPSTSGPDDAGWAFGFVIALAALSRARRRARARQSQ
jgi:MYXO-CTERM domain-containing protein